MHLPQGILWTADCESKKVGPRQINKATANDTAIRVFMCCSIGYKLLDLLLTSLVSIFFILFRITPTGFVLWSETSLLKRNKGLKNVKVHKELLGKFRTSYKSFFRHLATFSHVAIGYLQSQVYHSLLQIAKSVIHALIR